MGEGCAAKIEQAATPIIRPAVCCRLYSNHIAILQRGSIQTQMTFSSHVQQPEFRGARDAGARQGVPVAVEGDRASYGG